ncbi:MAG: hypothetical protein ACR2FY_01310 [Pirellulaceae bacterium]
MAFISPKVPVTMRGNQRTSRSRARKSRVLATESLESRSLLAGDLIGISGDFNSIGPDTIDSVGMYDPRTGTFYLRDENSAGFPQAAFKFLPSGRKGLPIAGDWNGDGVDTVGIYVPSATTFVLANKNVAGSAFQTAKVTGAPTQAVPLAGDWNGDSRDELALYNPATRQVLLKNELSAGAADSVFAFWPAGYDTSALTDLGNPAAWKALAGDFDGLPGDEIGLYHAATDELFFRGTQPGSAITKVSVFSPNYAEQPLAGDWDANGVEEIGFFNPWITSFELRNDLTPGAADSRFYVVQSTATIALPGNVAHVIGPAHSAPGQPEAEPPPPPFVPADLSLPFITENEVQQLLARAAAASSSEGAIIAIVDRNGKILGVRMEQGVLNAIGDDATRVFAIDGAVAKARTAAFFANDAGPLTSRTIRMISQSTISQREVESNPTVPSPLTNNPFNDADPTATTYGPGFVAPVGIGGHFPPGITNTPPVDLFGIERQSRDGKRNAGADGVKGNGDDVFLTNRFNVDGIYIPAGKTLEFPESYGVQSQRLPSAQSRGIATLPGGIPLYKIVSGSATRQLVGGIGVFFPGSTGYATFEQGFIFGINQSAQTRLNASRVLEAEWIAYAAAGGSSLLPGGVVGTLGGVGRVPGYDLLAGRIDLGGITLETYGPNPTAANPKKGYQTLLAVGSRVGQGSATTGANQVVDPGPDANPATTGDNDNALQGKPVPDGWLVLPHAGGGITAAEVMDIVNRSIAQADKTRAAIRVLPNGAPGARTRMVIAVADKDGNVLGLFRMKDATVFSIDVAVAKARNTAYYADPTALQPADMADDDLLVERGQVTQAELNARRIITSKNRMPGVLAVPDLFKDLRSTTIVAAPTSVAFTNRTFRFLAEPRYPAGIENTLPPIFSTLNDHNLNHTKGVNPKNGENLFGLPIPASMFKSVLGFDAFHQQRNFHDPSNLANQNGIVFFPGSSPLYRSRILIGGFGVSGDGVDQDDVVTNVGQYWFQAPPDRKADTTFYRGVRLPYQKFNRNPTG